MNDKVEIIDIILIELVVIIILNYVDASHWWKKHY